MTRVLLADDEQDLVWAVQESLSGEGYEVLTAYDGLEVLTQTRRYHPDLIVLDIVMPRLDGLQACRQLRRDANLASVPILFLTARTAVEDRITGLEEGGDDYLVKPFDLGELKARIRALLRRTRSRPTSDEDPPAEGRGSLLAAGPLTLDLDTSQVRVREKSIQLTPTEGRLLRHLMTNRGKIYSGLQLLKEVWGYSVETAEPSLVRWHIKNLRSKIEPDPAHPTFIRTVPHRGYILSAPHP
jgi:DNA-binding response OmpR family regulator